MVTTKRDHLKWGLEFPHYLDTLDHRMENSFKDYVGSKETTSIAHDGLLPLSLLETTLSVGENMHRVDYQHGEKWIPVLIATIRRHVELSEKGIFHYYYGYLCIRHLIRAVCIGILIENDLLNEHLGGLIPELEPAEANEILVDRIFQQMANTLLNDDTSSLAKILGYDFFYGDALFDVGGLSYVNAEILLMILWKDRRSIIELVERGMLLGLSTLLSALYGMLVLSDVPSATKKWTQLQDVAIRAYIASVNKTEQLAIGVLVAMNQRKITGHALIGDATTDDADARRIVRAYSDMTNRLSVKGLSPFYMTLGISNMTFEYVKSLLCPDLSDCIAEVSRSAFKRLWMELDEETKELLDKDKRCYVRGYASDIFRGMGKCWQFTASRDKPKVLAISQEVNLRDIIGRVVMMISREADNPGEWEYLREGLMKCRKELAAWFLPGATSNRSGLTSWARVFEQMTLLARGILPSRSSKKCLLEAAEVWAMFRPTSGNGELSSKQCVNPRCPTVTTELNDTGSNGLCGKCMQALYCSERCQHAHWYLPSVDSHALVCKASDHNRVPLPRTGS